VRPRPGRSGTLAAARARGTGRPEGPARNGGSAHGHRDRSGESRRGAQIDGVSEVYSVTGEFDLVAIVRVRSHDTLADVIPGQLNKVPGVSHTETHIAFRAYSRHDLEAAFALGFTEST
jgi:DNA-binding Lrp family transcriptional regulator